MQMMYEIIYRALKEVGLDDVYEPQDYLIFFCLGNREVSDSPSASSTADSSQVRMISCFPFKSEHIVLVIPGCFDSS